VGYKENRKEGSYVYDNGYMAQQCIEPVEIAGHREGSGIDSLLRATASSRHIHPIFARKDA